MLQKDNENAMKNLLKQFTEIFFPVFCAHCKVPGVHLCLACAGRLTTAKRDEAIPPNILSAFDYENEIVRSILYSYKYEGIKAYAGICAELCREKIKTLDEFDMITFVPLHKHKLNTRGFNQSELFAKAMFPNRTITPTLRKIKSTAAQMELTREQRLRNIRDTFEATTSFANKKVLLIDDVCTTGSTLFECEKNLRQAGAESVLCFTFAKD